MYFGYFVIISAWKKVGLFIWTNLNPYYSTMLCVHFGWNLPIGSGKGFCNFLNRYLHIIIISPWKRVGPFIWTNLSALCPIWVEIGPLVLEKKLCFIFINVFSLVVIISPWKRAGSFIWTNLTPLHLKMLCTKFGWNWPSDSREEDENVKI